jgi:hypothetical protein
MAGTIFIFGARWARLNIAMVNVPVLVPVSPKISQPAARHSCLGLGSQMSSFDVVPAIV